MEAKKDRTPCCLALVAAGLFIGLSFGIVSISAVWVLKSEQPSPSATVAVTRTLSTFTPTPTRVVGKIPKDKETCLAQGGKWGRIGLSPREECNLPTSDGGKVCTDTHECEGMCLAELTPAERDQIVKNKIPFATQGKCTPWRISVGCIAVIEQGQVKNILCID